MRGFRNIMVYVNATAEADPALRHAVDLARRSGAEIEVVDVVEPPSRLERLLHPVAAEVREIALRQKEERLESLVDALREEEFRVSWTALSGRPEVEISWEVVREDHDLVIRSGRAGREQMAFGPVAIRLMRVCPCAVLVVQPAHELPFRRILAAIDPDPSDPVKTELNERIIRTALDLARLEDAACHVVHAWSPLQEEALRSRMDEDTFEEYETRLHEAAEEAFEQALSPYRPELPVDRVHLLRGDPREILPRLIAEKGIDLAVMGTVARRGLQGLLVGNTAERVLRKVSCSVLTLKPEDFVSPVCT